MKANYQITKGTDYQCDKCYRVSYEEYGTLYTFPEPHYTKKEAQEKIKELKGGGDKLRARSGSEGAQSPNTKAADGLLERRAKENEDGKNEN